MDYAAPLKVTDLAQMANMSPSAFHLHFRQVTNMSPLQYQKQIRLQEARRLLTVDAVDAASVAFRGGYESPSQFSRVFIILSLWLQGDVFNSAYVTGCYAPQN